MKVAFRVDASVQIGSGHVMRCLTLADGLAQRGADIRFVSRHMPEYLAQLIVAKGYDWAQLDNAEVADKLDELAHASWLGCSQAEDALVSLQALSDTVWDWLVVDHYALDFRWESELRQAARHILVIDDIADRRHDCDMLLDQNYYRDMHARYAGKVPEHCRLLLGLRYVLLREEFRRLRASIVPRQGPVRRILIFFGGLDADNHTGSVMQSLFEMGLTDIQVIVVIGAQHPKRPEIEATCLRHGFDCHVQTGRMAELMAAADLSIGAGGGAMWERCCLGLPTIAIATAENQRMQIADAAMAGLVYSPDSTHDFEKVIGTHLAALSENAGLRYWLSQTAMRQVDARGVSRVIAGMGVSDIDIRRVNPDDSQKLFLWRNHSTIREFSRNSAPIEWEDHCRWFAALLSDPNRVLLIGLRCDEAVGVVRFDFLDAQAEISIYLVPGIVGYGFELLNSAEAWLAENYPQVNLLHAHVLEDNARSHKLFLSAGYRVESTDYFKKRL
jgi:UDP-2,4-diacetamido-2,4,6-trideoxy-beta-L-altropyranose hydrolase